MNRIEKMLYILFVLVTFTYLLAMFTSAKNKNWGSVADWTSGYLSLLAIYFVFLKFVGHEKEHESDKKEEKEREKLHNRPFFSLEKKTNLTHGLNIVWTDIEHAAKICDSFDKVYDKNRKLRYYSVKEQGYMYDFKNVSANSAINLTLVVSYIASSSEKDTINTKENTKKNTKENPEDVITLYRGVIQNESVTFMTPTMIEDKKRAMWEFNKKISLYFASVDGEWYRQDWLDEKSIKEENNFVSSKIEYQGIKQIDAAEVPNRNNAGYYPLEIRE